MPDRPNRLLVVDIDGLRQDVFHAALESRQVPNLAFLLNGEQAAHLNPVSTAPSITFCAQSTIFTGSPPSAHGIVGNQFFDRFGLRGGGPRFYAFDVGDRLAYDDAVLTFTGALGLLGQTVNPQTPTLYELAGRSGLRSTVVYHMLSRGANTWIRPSLLDIARFTKGGGLIGMSAEQYDGEMIEKTITHLRSGERPDVLTVYFMGLDHTSHHDGPGAQLAYLTRVVDALLGRLIDALREQEMLENLLAVVVSDHGQIEVVEDDRHSLRLSFPFDREMGYLFDALGLDVHDKPGEGPACDAVVASNGGLAHVYLRRRAGAWSDLPDFQAEVLPVARAFWVAHQTGAYSADLKDALAAVLVRDVQSGGWEAAYQALTADGRILPVEAYLAENPSLRTVAAARRLRELACLVTGDLLLISNYAQGFYFADTTTGVHGGLHPEDSLAVASLAWLGASPENQQALTAAASSAAIDGPPSLADLLPLVSRIMQWR